MCIHLWNAWHHAGIMQGRKNQCYTKILSPSCDKTFDIPTFPESQLLEWKPILNVNLS